METIFLVIVLIGGHTLVPTPRKIASQQASCPTSIKQEAKNDHDHTPPRSGIVANNTPNYQYQAPVETDPEKAQHIIIDSIPARKASGWNEIYVICTGLLVFVGIATLGAIWYQAVKTRDAADAAKSSANATQLSVDALIRSERSWALVHEIGNPEENWPYMVNSEYTPGILIRFKVFGKTPIRVTEARFVTQLVPSIPKSIPKQPMLPNIPAYNDISPDAAFGGDGEVVPVDAIIDIRCELNTHDYTRERMEEVGKGALLLCSYGVLRYTDNFGGKRESRACYVYDFSWGGVRATIDGEVLNPAGFRKAALPEYNKKT